MALTCTLRFPFSRLLLVYIVCWAPMAPCCKADDIAGALQKLSQADQSTDSQNDLRQAWSTVTNQVTVASLPEILAAMKDAGPLAENWLRAAVDSVAEREFDKTGSLPTEALESFIQDKTQAPRARRLAYEWLVQSDSTAKDRLLPLMIDDDSLELRYDAIARLLEEANSAQDEATKLQKFQRALRSVRDKAQLQACAEAIKELGQLPNLAKQQGFLTQWKVIGPFDNTDRKGFDRVFLQPENIDLAAEHDGKNGSVSWKDAQAEQEKLDGLGMVDLNEALVEEKSVVAYAFTTFVAEHDMDVQCRYESLEATKLWINGAEVAVNNVYHSGSDYDQYIVPCKLKRGENQILIKVCQNEQTEPWTRPWEFRLRITDELGGAIHPSE